MNDAKLQLGLAVAQFTGWKEAKQGGTILTLIQSMGLEEDEWRTLCKSGDVVWMRTGDLEEINAYFDKKSPNTRRRRLKSTEGIMP